MRKILIIVFVFFLKTFNSSAQTWEVEASVGAMGYVGDINPVKIYKVTDPALGIAVKRNFNGTWSAGVNLLLGKIRAKDSDSDSEYQRLRNLSFYSPITEVSTLVEFNFLNYIPGIRYTIEHHKITPFLFIGIGGVFFSPRASYNGAEYDLQTYRTESAEYPLYALTIPYGAGVKYNYHSNWSLLFKIGYRTVLTDYLDDVSEHYYLPVNPSNEIATALRDRSGEVNGGVNVGVSGAQRGDLRKYDNYLFIGFGISYNFVSRKCFTFDK